MRQTQIAFGPTACLLFFAGVGLLQTHSVIAESFETIEGIFWNGSAEEFASALQDDLKSQLASEREQRVLKYWRELVPSNGELSNFDSEQELSRIAIESSGGGVDGEESISGYFVRQGRTEDEARVEALRTWILTMNPDILPALIGNRLSENRVSTIDLITVDAMNTALADSNTGLQPLGFWVDLYQQSENPALRLIAAAKSKDAIPRSVSALSSESNEWTFATLVHRKRAFKEFAQDPNRVIREFAAEKYEAFSSAAAKMAVEYGYSESDVGDQLVSEIDWGELEARIESPKNEVNPSMRTEPEALESSKGGVADGETDDSSSRSPIWPYMLVAVAILGIVGVLVRSRKNKTPR